MRAGHWLKGVVVASTVLASGGSSFAGRETDLSVTPDGSDVSCEPISITGCFDVDSLKNITHIFVAFDACAPDPPEDPFSITVDGDPVPVDKLIPEDRLKDKGGPCNHGDPAPPVADDDTSGPNLIAKPRLWFPLQGNQKHARVCVTTDTISIIRVGAKSADECVQNTQNFCGECDDRNGDCD